MSQLGWGSILSALWSGVTAGHVESLCVGMWGYREQIMNTHDKCGKTPL